MNYRYDYLLYLIIENKSIVCLCLFDCLFVCFHVNFMCITIAHLCTIPVLVFYGPTDRTFEVKDAPCRSLKIPFVCTLLT